MSNYVLGEMQWWPETFVLNKYTKSKLKLNHNVLFNVEDRVKVM